MPLTLVPTLLHLSSVQVVTSMMVDPDILNSSTGNEDQHYRSASTIIENISTLKIPVTLKEKLKAFVVPLLYEFENWALAFQRSWLLPRESYMNVHDSIQHYWLYDGSIDREKTAQMLIRRSDISPLNLFFFACMYCMSAEVLNMWNNLSEMERAYLRHTYNTPINAQYEPYSIVRKWIEWIRIHTNGDWRCFVTQKLESAELAVNVYLLKRVSETICLDKRSKFLLEVLLQKEVTSDVMIFALQLMSREEREMIFSECPFKVLKCFLTWPSRRLFFNIIDCLWPYVTSSIFCSIVKIMLTLIKNNEEDYLDLVKILQGFWKESPGFCKKAVEQDIDLYTPLNFILQHDFSRKFSRRLFFNSLKPKYDSTTVYRNLTPAERKGAQIAPFFIKWLSSD